MVPRLLLSAAVLLNAGLLVWAGKRLERDSSWFDSGLATAFAMALIWLHAIPGRGVAVGIAVMLLLLIAGQWIPAVVLGLLAFGLGLVVPGGATVPILALLAVTALIAVLVFARRLRRIGRAQLLEPGKPPRREILFGGRVEALTPETVPGDDRICAAWVAQCKGEVALTSSSRFAIANEGDRALVDPRGATLSLELRSTTLTDETALAALRAQAPGKRLEAPVSISWLDEGAHAFVLGTPDWVSSSEVAGYRGTPFALVFCATARSSIYVADRPAGEVRRSASYQVLVWGAWGILSAVTAWLRAAGHV